MIKTLILLGIKENRPIWYKTTGLAKNMDIARWLFSYSGWSNKGGNFPEIVTYYEVIESKVEDSFEDNSLFVDEADTMWVLGSAVLLN